MTDLNKDTSNKGKLVEVLLSFLKLGCISFGGPIAHLSYFRKEFVERARWLSDSQFSQLLTICQFLPGPASSQLGFCVGLIRAGWLGAIGAFIAFTLPSAILLVGFTSLLSLFSDASGQAIIHGLKLVACVVVFDALLGMSKKLCPNNSTKIIAFFSTAILLVVSSAQMQLLVVALAAIVGMLWLKGSNSHHEDRIVVPLGTRLGGFFIAIFMILLLGLPILSTSESGFISFISVAQAFYQAGALVFGGGHVVLPLLQDSVVSSGWITSDQFLAGYGASQAIPGPMFAFSAYLGALISPNNHPYLMASTALLFIFLPGFLLVVGILPFWQTVTRYSMVKRAIVGVNASVVGLLAAALYHPIFTSAIIHSYDLAIVVIAFGVLSIWKCSPLIIVVGCTLASVFFL